MKEPTSFTEYLALPEAEKLKLAEPSADIPALLNCPFCGGVARMHGFRPGGNPGRPMNYRAGCVSEFGNCGWPSAEAFSQAEALARWNTRAP